MERLTENYIGCYQIKGCDNFTCEETCNNVLNCGCCPISEAINKLAEYEDLEEQGLLFRLPCKIGSTLYQPIYSSINEYKVIDLCFDIYNNKLMYEVAYEIGFECHKTVCDFNDIGKYVFLTKAEAEQKLKEIESD